MKKRFFLLTILVIATTYYSYAQADYSTTQTIQREGYSYQCDYDEENDLVTLYNSEDQLTYVRIKVKEGCELTAEDHATTINVNREEGNEKALQFTHEILSLDELQSVSERTFGTLLLVMNIDPETGNVLEVYFRFNLPSGWGQIPVEKYRQIEVNIKENITFQIAEPGRKLNYLQTFINV